MEKNRKICVVMSGNTALGKNSVLAGILQKGAQYRLDISVASGFEGVCFANFQNIPHSEAEYLIYNITSAISSSRYPDFVTKECQLKAAKALNVNGFDGLIVIGGDGSLRGACTLQAMFPSLLFIPATIDNDMGYTGYSVGFDTAMNTAIESIDRILWSTGISSEYCMIVAVPGREADAGGFAYNVALASGGFPLIPQSEGLNMENIRKFIQQRRAQGKRSHLIIAADNTEYDIKEITRLVEQQMGINCRYVVLGHIVRGGSPTIYDRITGIHFGEYAATLASEGQWNQALQLTGTEIHHMPIHQACNKIGAMVRWPIEVY